MASVAVQPDLTHAEARAIMDRAIEKTRRFHLAGATMIMDLGANVVRIHLQTGKFLQSADEPNEQALSRLKDLLALAEKTGLYLDLTGLACYHKQDVPAWYQANLHRLFVYIEEPLRRLSSDMAPQQRIQLARSLFSAVHGIVLIGLEEKLQSIPVSTVREQVTFMVEAFAKGLARQ